MAPVRATIVVPIHQSGRKFELKEYQLKIATSCSPSELLALKVSIPLIFKKYKLRTLSVKPLTVQVPKKKVVLCSDCEDDSSEETIPGPENNETPYSSEEEDQDKYESSFIDDEAVEDDAIESSHSTSSEIDADCIDPRDISTIYTRGITYPPSPLTRTDCFVKGTVEDPIIIN